MGRAFSAGINRLMHHGNAYPYVHQDGQRWYPFHPRGDSVFTAGPLDISFDIHPEGDLWPIEPNEDLHPSQEVKVTKAQNGILTVESIKKE